MDATPIDQLRLIPDPGKVYAVLPYRTDVDVADAIDLSDPIVDKNISTVHVIEYDSSSPSTIYVSGLKYSKSLASDTEIDTVQVDCLTRTIASYDTLNVTDTWYAGGLQYHTNRHVRPQAGSLGDVEVRFACDAIFRANLSAGKTHLDRDAAIREMAGQALRAGEAALNAGQP